MKQDIRFCTAADGVRLAYAVTGEGPVLVKAANYLTHLEYELNSPVWRHWITELSRDHSLVRYDERGCGLSDRDPATQSFEAWVSDLEAVVETLGLERFPLLGISKGGAVALSYAVRHPERVSQLILYGAFLRGRMLRAATPRQREEAETMMKLIELGWGTENAAFRQVFTSQFMPEARLEQIRSFNELQRKSCSAQNALRDAQVSNAIDVAAIAPRIRCPTLVLHARDDARVPFESGRTLASLIPGARFVPLESKNHILLEDEAAWRRFLIEVRSFLPAAPRAQGGSAFAELTGRERKLLEMLTRGLSNRDIAVQLRLSEKTVRNHFSSIFAKLGVSSRAQAIVRARDAGFDM